MKNSSWELSGGNEVYYSLSIVYHRQSTVDTFIMHCSINQPISALGTPKSRHKDGQVRTSNFGTR